MYLLLTAGQMPWDTTVIIIFVNFAALSECSCIRVLSKLFIYNGAFTIAHLQLRDSSPDDLFPMKYDMLITNFVEIYFVTKRNWILRTEREKLNEENEMKLFQSTYSVLLCGVGTFDVSVHYQQEIDPWRKMSKQIVVKLYNPYTNRCLDQDLFCHRIAI